MVSPPCRPALLVIPPIRRFIPPSVPPPLGTCILAFIFSHLSLHNGFLRPCLFPAPNRSKLFHFRPFGFAKHVPSSPSRRQERAYRLHRRATSHSFKPSSRRSPFECLRQIGSSPLHFFPFVLRGSRQHDLFGSGFFVFFPFFPWV